MKRKTMILICVIFIVLFCSVIGMFVYGLFNPLSHEYYIFEQIRECEQLIPAYQTDAKADRYNDASGDKDAKGLSYDEFFGINFISD